MFNFTYSDTYLFCVISFVDFILLYHLFYLLC